MTDIPDTRTYREKQDDRIAALENIAELNAELTHNLKLCVDDLNARVAQLERENTLLAVVVDDMTKKLNSHEGRIAKLEAQAHCHAVPYTLSYDCTGTDPATITWYSDPPHAAVTVAGTPGTSWQPGGWVDQFAAEVDD